MHASSLAALSLLPSVAAEMSQASVGNGSAISSASASPRLYGRDPKYTAPKANTRSGAGSTTPSAFATTAAGFVTASTSVKPTPTSSHPQSTTTGTAYATNAASILCGAAGWVSSGCQSRNDVAARARSVVATDFNATKAGEVMTDLADLSSCSSGGSFDSLNAGQKKDLRKAGDGLKNSDGAAVSAVQSTLHQCQVQTNDGDRSQPGSMLAAAAGSVALVLAAVV